MAVELGRTPSQSEVFARTHTRKEDREWVDKRASDVNVSRKLEYGSFSCFTFSVLHVLMNISFRMLTRQS
ncbi:hypothetical protein PIB30_110402 [Stylosanthes scabra]|uniref:Uncharacterized protein n=1 Tax=Stylosanthes scabra TaxID=79078 RepID=A0ABU6R088_9FABA|nr:hypothetical protein [Stylosanthes scabra]